jgi:hypothetical protein
MSGFEQLERELIAAAALRSSGRARARSVAHLVGVIAGAAAALAIAVVLLFEAGSRSAHPSGRAWPRGPRLQQGRPRARISAI